MRVRPISPGIRAWIEVVVDENADDLLRYLQRRVEQPEDAADLLGRALLALWENGAKIPTSDTEARMWCFGIARNIVREHYRHTTRRLDLANRLRDYLLDTASHDNAADMAAEANSRANAVRAAVRALDKKSRELVMLVHWDGFTIAEAARVLAINESTARTRHSRALVRLKHQTHHLRNSVTQHAGTDPSSLNSVPEP